MNDISFWFIVDLSSARFLLLCVGFFPIYTFLLPFSSWSLVYEIGFVTKHDLAFSFLFKNIYIFISVYAFSLMYLYGKYDERFKWLPKGIWILLGDCYVLFCDKHSCNRIVLSWYETVSNFDYGLFSGFFVWNFFSAQFDRGNYIVESIVEFKKRYTVYFNC